VRAMARGIERGDEIITFPPAMAAFARLLHAMPRFLYEPLASRARPAPRGPG